MRLGEKIISGIKVILGITSGIIIIIIIVLILGIIPGVYSKCGLRGGGERAEGKKERGEKRKITFKVK